MKDVDSKIQYISSWLLTFHCIHKQANSLCSAYDFSLINANQEQLEAFLLK